MGRTNWVALLIVSSMIFGAPFARAGERLLTLNDCEQLALKHDRGVRDARLRMKTAEARKLQAAHARILPKFEVRNIWGPVPRARGSVNEFGVIVSPDTATGLSDLRYFTEIEMNLVQPIYTFGKLSGLNAAAGFGIQAEELNLEKQERSATEKVRELYWGLLLGKELLAVVDEARSEVSKASGKIEEKLDEGSEDVSQADLFKLQIFEYEVNKKHRQALDNIQLARSALRVMVGLEDSVDFDIAQEYLEPVPFTLDSLQTYFRVAAKSRPEVGQLYAGLNLRQALTRVARSDYYPQFFFGGQVKYNYAKDRFDPNNPFVHNPTNFFRPGFVIGANLNLNFVQTRDKVRLAQIEYRRLAEKQELLDKGIRLEVEKAYLAARQSAVNLRESRKALRASENWLRSTTMTFDLGVGEIKELIDAFKANGQMKAEHLQNIFEYNTAIAKLSRAVARDLFDN